MSALSEQCEVLRLWAKQLREGEPILASDLREAADTILNLRDTAQQAQSENAKLRELCAEMFEAVKCCCGEWCTKTASNCDNNECGCRKCYVALRELGIEVE